MCMYVFAIVVSVCVYICFCASGIYVHVCNGTVCASMLFMGVHVYHAWVYVHVYTVEFGF